MSESQPDHELNSSSMSSSRNRAPPHRHPSSGATSVTTDSRTSTVVDQLIGFERRVSAAATASSLASCSTRLSGSAAYVLPKRAAPPSRNPTWSCRPRLAAEVRAVGVVHDREDAAARRDARLALVTGVGPCRPEALDLLGLQLVERHAGVLGEEGRAHQVHALLAAHSAVARVPAPHQIRSRRPGECGSTRKQAGRVGQHRVAGWAAAKPSPREDVEEDRGRGRGPCRRGRCRRLGRVAEVSDSPR